MVNNSYLDLQQNETEKCGARMGNRCEPVHIYLHDECRVAEHDWLTELPESKWMTLMLIVHLLHGMLIAEYERVLARARESKCACA